MSYPHEGEIRGWIENYNRWSPDGFGRRQWADAVTTSAYHSAPIPVLGGEARDTQAALARMARRERSALEEYHLQGGSMAKKAKRLRISKRTLERRLHLAHHHFYELRWAVRHDASIADRANTTLSLVGRQGLKRKTAGIPSHALLAKPSKESPR